VFLAACAASDKDEVQRLLIKGADIDTANIDGLTALHQVKTGFLMLWGRRKGQFFQLLKNH
jgi:protein phosphatase 1 regulatory subunit 12A